MGENTFSITPMSKTFTLEPGKVYEGSLKVVNHNESKDALNYKVSVMPYNVVDQDYTADFMTMGSRNEIAKWIKIDNSTGTVKPNEANVITYRIEVPENVPSGGQYALIAVSADSNVQEDNAVTNVLELASVIYAEVLGETTYGGSIIDNIVPVFSFVPEIQVGSIIENTGNVHDYANIKLEVKNFFTGEVIYPTKEDEGEFSEIIMPETTRYISRLINNVPELGMMHITQTVNYNGEISVVERNVLVCPMWFLILVVVVFFILVTIIVSKIRRLRKKRAEY